MGLFTTGSTFASVVSSLISFINLCVAVLAPLALVIFFWGLVRYIYHSDDAAGQKEGRETIVWSLIALFVLFSVWGILAILNVAFFGGSFSGGYNTSSSGSYGTTPTFNQNFGSGVGQVPPSTPGRPDFTPQ